LLEETTSRAKKINGNVRSGIEEEKRNN